MIVKNAEERDYYLNIVESWRYKHELQKVILQRDKRQMKRFFELYKSTGRMTLNEKIEFLTIMNPAKMIIFKIYRRIKMMFGNS